ncbi:hypothetical protein JS510_01485 [Mycoplasma tauri]|uniref:S41 family peptidase n=1 Tax=Mycoplasma tauri TaxID=547987 RepID=UPI0019671F91|nr:S41 family peptidase [Mycoplasma tauri]QSB07777.1 hypothetical protein JS510_01485 [Mycoplasma tauri]
MRKIFRAPALFISITSPIIVLSCVKNYKGDENRNKIVKDISFRDVSKSYKFINQNPKIKTYFFDNKNTPYISVPQVLKTLDGAVNNSAINKSLSGFFDNKNYSKYHANNASVKFDWIENTIEISNTRVFHIFNSQVDIDYGKDLKLYTYKIDNLDNKNITIDLDNYGWDIYSINKEPIIPLAVFNSLFLSPNYYNLYYNGSEFYGGDLLIPSRFRTKDGKGTELGNEFIINPVSKDSRIDAYNSLRFNFDYFYGLREEKGYKSGEFDKFIHPKIIQKILSTDESIYNEGYLQLFYGQLNDLHSKIFNYGYKTDFNNIQPNSKIIEKANENYKQTIDSKFESVHEIFKNARNNLQSAREKQINEILKKEKVINVDDYERLNHGQMPIVRFLDNNTAVITIDNFVVGAIEELKDEKPYKYDTFELMKKALTIINSKFLKGKIILDLSLNTGGSAVALYKTMALMKHSSIFRENNKFEDIVITSTNILNKEKTEMTYRVNVPEHIKGNYDWYIQTSPVTYSAANALVANMYADKINKFGAKTKLIGQKSGGGAAVIIPIVLSDGTKIIISSNSLITYRDEKSNYHSAEKGFKVEDKYLIKNHFDYYKKDKLLSLLNQD